MPPMLAASTVQCILAYITFASLVDITLMNELGNIQNATILVNINFLTNVTQYNKRINGYYDQYPIYSLWTCINELIF